MKSPSISTDRNCDHASRQLYDAEFALHIARQSGVDDWIKAAAERLHEAIVAYQSARSPAA